MPHKMTTGSRTKPEHDDVVKNYLNGVKDKTANGYMLTTYRDDEPHVRTIIFYDNAIAAAEAYNMYNDWGFAKKYLTICIYEPSGGINTKTFKRNQAGDPAFVRQNYIDMSDVLLGLKNILDKEVYEDACIKIMTSFAKDNWRFDPERFLRILGIEKNLDS